MFLKLFPGYQNSFKIHNVNKNYCSSKWAISRYFV